MAAPTQTHGGMRGALDPELYDINEDEWGFFSAWTKIEDREEFKALVMDVQKRTYAIVSHPCIHSFSFLHAKAASRNGYDQALKLKDEPDALFVDIGCFCGTDARKVVADGWPASKVIGTDLRQAFIDIGYELFRDSPKDPRTPAFIAGDLFDAAFLDPQAKPVASAPDLHQVKSLNELAGRARAIHAGSMFHLFGEEGQRDLAVALVALASREPGTVLFGEHVGSKEPRSIARENEPGRRFQHSDASFEQLWRDVFGPELGPKLDIHCELRDRSQSQMTARRKGELQPDDRWMQGIDLLSWRVTVR